MKVCLRRRAFVSLWLLAVSFAVGGLAVAGAAPSLRAITKKAWRAPRVDVERLVREDAERLRQPDGVRRVGFPMSTSLTPADSGSWTAGPSGARTWRLVVRSEGALWLVLGFDRFHPGPAAELWVSSLDGSTRLGPFAAADANAGRLWLPPIDGDTLLVELSWPGSRASDMPDLRLSTVSHGYRPLSGGDDDYGFIDPPPVGVCEIDVNCELGESWQDEKRGIVRLLINGECFCTGSLINNTDFDCEPYVYTADHCFYQCPAGGDDVTFWFNYEQPACEPGEVSPVQTVTGAELVARHPQSDARLLRILQPIPASYQVYFNGWNRSNTPATQSYTIHHPLGDVRKISFNDDPLTSSTAYQIGTHWRIVDWEQGVTEAGSSGAPLFDPAGRIVGELHSGSSSCGCDPQSADCSDHYGRFSSAWLGGGSLATSLYSFLDPASTGSVALAGMDASFCGNPAPQLVSAAQQSDDSQGNENGVPDPGDIALLLLSLENEGPKTASGPVGATLSTDDPEVEVLRDHAGYAAIASGQTVQSQFPSYMIDIDPDRDCDRSILFGVEATAAQGSWASEFRVYTGQEVGTLQAFSDDMETGAPGWVPQILQGSTTWELQPNLGHSGVSSWYASNAFLQQDTVLRAPILADLPARALLRFYHALSVGSGDGGVLEYSIDGVSWIDARELIVTGKYNSVLPPTSSSVLAGRFLWTGGDINAWRLVEADLSAFEGQDLRLRWRFATDNSGSGIGWFLDDVVLETPDFECAPARNRLVPGAACRGHRASSSELDAACGERRPAVDRPDSPSR